MMSFINRISFWAFPILLVFLAVLMTYGGLTETFYQQDEWWVFGNVIASSNDGVFHFLKNTLNEAGKVHAIPISASIPFIEYKLFGINFEAYAAVSIVNHLIASILVYILALILFKNRFLALLSSLLFAVYGISHQAITWVAAVNTQSVVIFSLLCLIFFLKYIQQTDKSKFIFFSFLFLFTALFSNESAFSLFIILPIIWFIFKGIGDKKNLFRALAGLFILGLLYLLIRIPIWLNAKTIVLNQAQVLTQPDLGIFIYRLLLLPFRILPQTFISQETLLNLSGTILKLGYPDVEISPYGSLVKETLVLDLICIFLSLIIIVFFIFCYKKLRKDGKLAFSRSILVGLTLLVISGVMLIFIPGRAGFVSIFEKKHLYMSSVGAAILIPVSIYAAIFVFTNKKLLLNLLVAIIIIPILLINSFKVQTDIKELKKIGSLRKSFLTTIYHDYPDLPKRVVFYLQSDTSYYGMPQEEKNLPIQTGFGRMLLVWYQDSEVFPPCMYEELFLNDLVAQGYKNCGSRGFGFFRSYPELISTLKKEEIPLEDVKSYSWNGSKQEFKKINLPANSL